MSSDLTSLRSLKCLKLAILFKLLNSALRVLVLWPFRLQTCQSRRVGPTQRVDETVFEAAERVIDHQSGQHRADACIQRRHRVRHGNRRHGRYVGTNGGLRDAIHANDTWRLGQADRQHTCLQVRPVHRRQRCRYRQVTVGPRHLSERPLSARLVTNFLYSLTRRYLT